jgi:FlaA1/EpsC-like NDP-sugar epimerase
LDAARKTMLRLFKHYIPRTVALLALIDFFVLILAAELAWVIRAGQIGMLVEPLAMRWTQPLAFAVVVQLGMIAVGVYGPEAMQSPRFMLMRLLAAVSLAVILLATLYFLFPGVALWRSNLAYAMPLAIILPLTMRLVLRQAVGTEVFRRRVLVLGAGARAQRIGQLADSARSGFVVVGYVAMTDAEPASTICPIICSLWMQTRLCSRSKNGAMRCRSTICCG